MTWMTRKGESLCPSGERIERRILKATYLYHHLCAWEGGGTDSPRSCAKAHRGQGGDLRQPAQLHPGHVLPDQVAFYVGVTLSVDNGGYRCHLSGPLTWSSPTSLSLNWREKDLMGALLNG